MHLNRVATPPGKVSEMTNLPQKSGNFVIFLKTWKSEGELFEKEMLSTMLKRFWKKKKKDLKERKEI